MKIAKKTGAVLLAAGLIFVGIAHEGTARAETIEIVGTGDGVIVLKAVGKAFSEANPGVAIEVPKSIGSGGGVKAVGNDKNVLGRVARPIKDKEKGFGLSYVPFTKIPTVFFVNKSVDVDGLTAAQICDIYSGKITNWKDVGGKDARIKVVRREDGDSSLGVLKKTFPGFGDITITEKSKTAESTPDNVETVESKEGTIGFGPYDVVRAADAKVLKIDGKGPFEDGYPSHGTIGLIFKEANKTGNVEKFIKFATSPDAREAISGAGGSPL